MAQFNKIFEDGLDAAAMLVNESHIQADDLEDQATMLEK